MAHGVVANKRVWWWTGVCKIIKKKKEIGELDIEGRLISVRGPAGPHGTNWGRWKTHGLMAARPSSAGIGPSMLCTTNCRQRWKVGEKQGQKIKSIIRRKIMREKSTQKKQNYCKNKKMVHRSEHTMMWGSPSTITFVGPILTINKCDINIIK